MTTVQDIVALEAAMWADISDRLAVGAARTSAVEVTEQLARCDIIAQRAAYITALSTSFVQRALRCAHTASAEASAAAREALAWGKIGDAAAAQSAQVAKETAEAIKAGGNAAHPSAGSGEDGAAFETRLAHAKDELSVAETRVLELHTKEAAAEAAVEQRRRDVAALESEAAHLREAVARLRREELETERSLSDRRTGSLDERRTLESDNAALRTAIREQQEELEQLKASVVMERERLAAAKEEHTATAMDRIAVHAESELRARSSAPAESSAAVPAPVSGGAGAFSSGSGAFDSYESSSSPNTRGGGPSRAFSGTGAGGEQTIESGLAALQNVRNQLRELRGQSSPTGAVSGGTPNAAARPASPPRGSSTSVASPTDAGLRRAATYTSYGSPSSGSRSEHPSLIGSARLQTSASMILESNSAAGPSPWKQRLMKLQGDLRTLRSELGATASGSPPRHAGAH